MSGPGMELIGEEEIAEVMDVLKSGYLYRYGNKNDPNFKQKTWNLEQDFARATGAKYALAVNSGTNALLTALWALGIGPGDEVIVPGYTFVASITSIIFARAIPILAEVDETLTLSPEDVEKKINPRTKAIMLVHMLGNPGHIDELQRIAKNHHIFLIEDCAQAMGTQYHGRSVGTYGEIGIFSLNVYKTITAGDGGLLITDDEELFKRAFAIHDQGHLPLRQGVEQGKRTILGLNFRMNELTSAVAGAQLKKLPEIRRQLHYNKEMLKSFIADIPQIMFRTVLDRDGDVGNLLTFFMPTKAHAVQLAEILGCTTVASSGWHVYSNMEHLLSQSTVTKEGCPFTCPFYQAPRVSYTKDMLPRTNDLVERGINISVGVSDAGLGSAFGITIRSTPEEIRDKGLRLRSAIELVLQEKQG